MYDSELHFRYLFEQTPAEFSFQAKNPAEVIEWQSRFRPRLRQALGLDSMQETLAGFQPRAEQLESVDCGDYLRESWRIWVEPTVPLPFYLLRPVQIPQPLPLVLTPHGHNHPHIYAGISYTDEERQRLLEGERDIAVQAVREGYLAIAPTTRAFGETRTNRDREQGVVHSCRTELMNCLLVGRTPIGERIWDMSRLIDWAITHMPVDANRVAITGNSGGGTVSLFAAACDTRIAVSMPGSYFCTFRGSIGSIHHCDCNYIPGILRLGEMAEVAGLIAPRPFCAIHGRRDEIFPIQHTQAAFARLQQIYLAAEVPERCGLYVGEGGHRYYKDGAWPFLKKWFHTI
jgi:hypothetical protein